MAQFRVKNLLVDIVSPHLPDLDKLCLWPTPGCFPGTCRVFFTGCRLYISPCRWYLTPIDWCRLIHTRVFECEGASRPCAGSDLPIEFDTELLVIDVKKLSVNPELIKEVQAELDDLLVAAAERGAEINKAMGPQTLAQADVLADQLRAALDEIEKLRGNLK